MKMSSWYVFVVSFSGAPHRKHLGLDGAMEAMAPRLELKSACLRTPRRQIHFVRGMVKYQGGDGFFL